MRIRQAKATDVNAIHELIKAHSDYQLMLPRSKYKIASRLQGFVVVEDSQNNIVGCGALTILWDDLAEIQSLSIEKESQGKGYGKKIVRLLIERANALAIPKVLTLTYQVDFFSKLGFQLIDKDSIPRKLWGECLECPKLENCDETAMIYRNTIQQP
ncbi:MAG: N-acetyltransferase [bacterium]|nr:N-acetyltransferase [bacterium]